ncbi:MAG: sigma-70 family RNA polymerase sigma factor [Tissierella sp.]|uniref:sigma-70 family RNA polymerase sigma factor n=1 Tax=Tissierella sp. TaxID=41274 RepID=UPI003F9AF62A
MYEEWKELLKKAKQGEKDIKEEILNRLRPLIISSIKRYYNRREDYEELIQEGDLCILECIENFDIEKKVYFLGYVKLQLRYLYLNKHKEKEHFSLNIMVGDEKGEEFINTIPSDDTAGPEDMIKVETHYKLQNALKRLTARQKKIVLAFYMKRKSITAISKDLGVSYRTIVNTKTKAIEKLKHHLEA